MEFYLRQFFFYGKILVPHHEHHLMALFHIICLAMGLIAGIFFLLHKNEDYTFSGAMLTVFSVLATIATIYAIS